MQPVSRLEEPITEEQRHEYRGGGKESDEHLWVKRELDRLFREYSDNEIFFEVKLGNRTVDCLIEGPIKAPNEGFFQYQGCIIEIVAHSEPDYKKLTEHALRHGYGIYWVVSESSSDWIDDPKDELNEWIEGKIGFGRCNSRNGTLELGRGIWFSNYEYIVDNMSVFAPRKSMQPGWYFPYGRVRLDSVEFGGFNLGVFEIKGERKQVFSDSDRCRNLCLQPAVNKKDRPSEEVKNYIETAVEAGEVKRLGPIAGYRPKRYRDLDYVSDAYKAPNKIKSYQHDIHVAELKA